MNAVFLSSDVGPAIRFDGAPRAACIWVERALRELHTKKIATQVRVVGPDKEAVEGYLEDVIRELNAEGGVQKYGMGYPIGPADRKTITVPPKETQQ
jgi:hypothetical protein